MGAIQSLLQDVPVPQMVRIRQKFDDTHIPVEQIPRVLREQLSRPEIAGSIPAGGEVAITAGSRGVANIVLIIRTIADFVKEKGAVPFVVPAMGSHGGATAEGQLAILESYSITEESIGCAIRSSMETVQIGTTPDGKPVRIDKYAAEADGIIVAGRVKPHTAFRGPYESGLMKMMTIGLGKQYGASIVHAAGFEHFAEDIPKYGTAILKNARVLFGVGILENAYDKTRELHALTPQEIIEKEPELLVKAKAYMPRICFDSCDVLVVDEIGKDISGDGMDPNISGRFCTDCASGGIDAQRVAVLDLTAASHGNANGLGLADVTTRRMLNKMDFEATYPNTITNKITETMKIPMVMGSDKLAIQMALRTCFGVDEAVPRVVRIQNTMKLEYIEISEAMLEVAKRNPQIEIVSEAAPLPFDEEDNLLGSME